MGTCKVTHFWKKSRELKTPKSQQILEFSRESVSFYTSPWHTNSRNWVGLWDVI